MALAQAVRDVLPQLDWPLLRHEMGKQLRYVDAVDVDENDLNGPPTCHYVTPVDRALPPTGANRSIFSRLLALVHDAAGLPLCSAEMDLLGHHYAPCELFVVPDLATFYFESLAGRAVLTLRLATDSFFGRHVGQSWAKSDWVPGSPMAWLSGIDGFVVSDAIDPRCDGEAYNCLSYTVTPRAAHRLVFHAFDTAMDRAVVPSGTQRIRTFLRRPLVDGRPYDALHAHTLFAWECGDFLDHLAPLVKVFSDHGRTDLLVALLVQLHAQWEQASGGEAAAASASASATPSLGLAAADSCLRAPTGPLAGAMVSACHAEDAAARARRSAPW